MQKERLQEDFGKALNSFQRLQTEAAERERAKLATAKQQQISGGDEAVLPPPSDQSTGVSQQSRTQMMIQVKIVDNIRYLWWGTGFFPIRANKSKNTKK